jgi:hypothetical protein
MILSLKQIRPQVFHIECASRRELGMLFLRYTEFYESKYDHIRGQRFTLVEQQQVYCREHLGSADANWTYTTDWSGYNIPARTIDEVHSLGIPDPNHYDSLMAGIYGMIKAEALGKEAYLIGTTKGCPVETLRHELTHALFCLNQDYRGDASAIIHSCGVLGHLCQILFDGNYPDKVHTDEINAYLTTGDAFFNVSDYEFLQHTEAYKMTKAALVELHQKYFMEFMA